MSAATTMRFTPEEYLEFDRNSEEKYEYSGGEIYALFNVSFNHSLISGNLDGLLRRHLKEKEFKAYLSKMRVFAPETGLYTYADLVVAGVEAKFKDDVSDTLLNPVLLIEVISDGTQGYERGKKFQHYRSIVSLQEYILVSQDEARIEKYLKNGDGFWVLSDAVGLQAEIKFDSIDCVVALSEVYDKVDFTDE